MTLFDVDDENERTTLQVAFSAMQAVGTAAASIAGGALFASFGSDHDAYLIVFFASAFLRFCAVILLVRHLPRLLFSLPQQIVQRAWVLAIRPWGGTILRPFVEGIDRLMRRDDDDR
jgi:MFS family permease